MVEAGIGKDGQCAHGGEYDEDPEEHAVDHHGNVLPILLQLAADWWMKRKGKMDRWGEIEEEMGREQREVKKE